MGSKYAKVYMRKNEIIGILIKYKKKENLKNQKTSKTKEIVKCI